MNRSIIPLLVLILLFGCGDSNEVKEPEHSDSSVCPQVDSLVHEIDLFKESLNDGGNNEVRENKLGVIIDLMDQNATVDGDCNYLNTDLYPDHLRFDFVENLRDWAVRDTFIKGIYYLLELRGAWSDDSAIYEFFSEEIARVAIDNPSCYDGYLRSQPGQVTMVLNTTKWSYNDIPQVKSQFVAIQALPDIIEFLDQLKPNLP